MDAYELLGISRDATRDEIVAAYRTLSKKHHPDAGGRARDFIRINNAYRRVIKDFEARHHQKEKPTRPAAGASGGGSPPPDTGTVFWEFDPDEPAVRRARSKIRRRRKNTAAVVFLLMLSGLGGFYAIKRLADQVGSSTTAKDSVTSKQSVAPKRSEQASVVTPKGDAGNSGIATNSRNNSTHSPGVDLPKAANVAQETGKQTQQPVATERPKQTVDKAKVSPAETSATDLLRLIEPSSPAVSREGNSVVLLSELDPSSVHQGIPVWPDGDYQLLVKFTRLRGRGGPFLSLPVGPGVATLGLDYEGRFSGLEMIDGHVIREDGNPTRVEGSHLVDHKEHVLEAEVSSKGREVTVRVDLDRERLIEWKGDPTSFTTVPVWSFRDSRILGLHAWASVIRFDTVQLSMLSGTARTLQVKP